MIVTPFGDLEFGDTERMRPWLAAHSQRHRAYGHALALKGIAIQPALISSEVTADWARIHYLTHMTLLRNFTPDQSISSQILSATPTRSPRTFYDWHRMHNLIHTRLDQALGVR